jgi:hypothetical protein
MLCGLQDDDRNRFELDGPEDESPLTDMEKRIQWICDAWSDALTNDNYDEWRDVRMMLYGAKQTLIHCNKFKLDEWTVLDELSDIAFHNGLDCISRGLYEGA